MKQLNGVKKDMEGFESRQKAVQVRTWLACSDIDSRYSRIHVQAKVEKAAEKRMEAQNSIKHYDAKLAEEQTKVNEANEAAKVLEEEFEASSHQSSELLALMSIYPGLDCESS